MFSPSSSMRRASRGPLTGHYARSVAVIQGQLEAPADDSVPTRERTGRDLPSWPCEFDSRHPLPRKALRYLPLSSSRGPKMIRRLRALGPLWAISLSSRSIRNYNHPRSRDPARPSRAGRSMQHAWSHGPCGASARGCWHRLPLPGCCQCGGSPPRPAQRPVPSAATSLPSGCRSDLRPFPVSRWVGPKDVVVLEVLGGVRGNPLQCPRYCHWG